LEKIKVLENEKKEMEENVKNFFIITFYKLTSDLLNLFIKSSRLN
jgi:hypothetical protein